MAKKFPDWLRALNILFGFIGVFLSLVVLANPALTIASLILFLSLIFIVFGIARVLVGVLDENISSRLQMFNILIGVVSFLVAIFSIIYYELATTVLVYLFSFVLLLIGISRIWSAKTSKLANWFRFILFVVGLITIVFSFLIFVYPVLGFTGIVAMIAISLLMNGLTRIISGLSGVRQKDIKTTRRIRKKKERKR